MDARDENTDAFKNEYRIFWAGNKKSFEMIVAISLALNQENWPSSNFPAIMVFVSFRSPTGMVQICRLRINKHIIYRNVAYIFTMISVENVISSE